MPIKYIQFFAKRNGQLLQKLKLAANTHLAVDGDALLYYLYIQFQNFSYGGDSLRLYDSAMQFFEKLESQAIKITVFIPGYTFEGEQVEKERGDIRVNVAKEFMKLISDEPGTVISRSGKGFRFHVLHRSAFIQALKDSKIEYVCCDGPVTPFLADFAIEKKVPILAYDSVYLMYDIPAFYHIDNIYSKDVNFEVQAIVPAEIAKYFDLTFEQYQLLCRVTPNEVIQSEFAGIRHHFGENSSQANGKDPKDNMLMNIAEFIKTNGSITELLEKFIKLELVEQEQAKLRNSESKMNLDEKVVECLLKLESAKAVESDSFGAKEAIAKAEEGLKIVKQQQSHFKVIEVQKSEKELRSLLVSTGQLCYRHKYDDVMPNAKHFPTTTPKWVASFFKFGKLPVYLLEAMENGSASFLPSLESFDGDCDFGLCAADAGVELRKILYGLLGLKAVKEWKRHGDIYQCQELSCVSPFDISSTTKLKVDERANMVLRSALQPFFKEADAEVADIMKNAKTANTQILFAVYKIMIKICPKISQACAAALITSSFCPQNQFTVQKVSGLNQINRSVIMFHYMSIFQYILEPILSLNQLLGGPIAVLPQTIFSGPTILIQYDNELKQQSPFTSRTTYEVLNSKQFHLSDNMVRFTNFKKGGSERVQLTKPEMQIYEHREVAPELVYLINNLVFLNQNLFSYNIETLETNEDEEIERQSKTKGVDFVLTKQNKFEGLTIEGQEEQ